MSVEDLERAVVAKLVWMDRFFPQLSERISENHALVLGGSLYYVGRSSTLESATGEVGSILQSKSQRATGFVQLTDILLT